ncbi:MAG: DUF58 domain-containing protein [Gammaproteobacteria bacterium]
MAGILGDRLTARARRWARRRQGRDPLVVRLDRRRIYILPTRFGLMFAAILFAMLLASLNYSNSLGFVLTFLLAGLGFLAMHACHRNLAGLEVAGAPADSVFAGNTARFSVRLVNNATQPRNGLCLTLNGRATGWADLDAGDGLALDLPVPAPRRGRLASGRFGLRTRYPFGLFQAWAWIDMPLECLVWPAPADSPPPPPATAQGGSGPAHGAASSDDFSGLRDYQPGDSPAHIAWKALAREQGLMTKQFGGGEMQKRWLDFDQVPAGDAETRLEILCRWLLDAERNGDSYGLRLPAQQIAPGGGKRHLRACLDALARFRPTRGAK